MRTWATLLLLFSLSWFGIGSAYAQVSIQTAYASCINKKDQFDAAWPDAEFQDVCVNEPANLRFRTIQRGASHLSWGTVYTGYTVGCSSGTQWSEITHSCFDPQQCLVKNDALGNSIKSTTTSTNGCDSGCAMSMGTNYTTNVWTVGGSSVTMFTGPMRYTGLPCSGTPTKPPNNQEPECTAIQGQSVCKRPIDDKLCAKASSTGKYVCWAPGETGEKTTDNVKQKRDAGENPIPPNLNLPNGDQLQQQGQPIKTQETTPGRPNITTNITNYNTVNGTNAGPSNDGENADGSGSEGEEGEEGDGNGLTGGTNCVTPPGTTGDPVLGFIALQTWKASCFGQVGDNPESHYGDGNGNGEGEPTADDVKSEQTFGGDGFDESGFGWGSTCPDIPTLEIGGKTIDLDASGLFCDWMTIGGYMVMLIAGLACLRILWSA